MSTSWSERIEALRCIVCAGCLGLSIGWLLVSGWSPASQYGHLRVGMGQVAVILVASVAAIVGLVAASRRIDGFRCGYLSVAGSCLLLFLAGWIGLAIATGGLHRIPSALDEAVTALMIVGCGVAFVSILLPLQKVRHGGLVRSGLFVVGLAMLMATPFLFER